MKIVVLDGYCLNPGDLSWDGLRRFGEVEVFDRTPEEEVVARAAGAAIALTNKTVLSATALRKLPFGHGLCSRLESVFRTVNQTAAMSCIPRAAAFRWR